MANYTDNEKATGLDVLTTLANDDVLVLGDTSDNGKAKVITKTSLKAEMGSGLVNATATDTTASYLDDKIEITSNDSSITITKTLQNAGTNEKISYDIAALGGGGGGSGGGGTKLDIDTTEVVVLGSDTVDAYTINIPGGTLGTNNAVRFQVKLSLVDLDGTGTFTITYGGQTVGTFTTSGSGDTEAIIKGTVIASGATATQKGEIVYLQQSSNIIKEDGNDVLTVDSTVDQDLIVNVVTDSGSKATFESVIVEEITSASTNAIVTFPMPLTPLDNLVVVGANIIDTPTTAYVGLVSIPTGMIANSISIRTDTTVTTPGTVDLTLYSEDGQTQLFSVTTGTISTATTIYTTALSAVSIPAGNYYITLNSNSTFDGEITFYNMYNNSAFAISALRNGVTGKPLAEGTLTITSGTPPTTITPTSLISGNNSIPVFRLDN